VGKAGDAKFSELCEIPFRGSGLRCPFNLAGQGSSVLVTALTGVMVDSGDSPIKANREKLNL